ncbi:hypothetical protein M409DRAFT_48619 [Zasmidium cellare ATCC 36951]|uniref:Methyltransferase type 11 domain-containing protein n=1 Tax=Zasmidium cellare ATCC 36951 TaxID=1080233 RepID=A0A6A6D5J0_ZASCE|nr:uncharacterized protein M409DRAFT_48619 [Zasmidium cellare ATCC 36951]KAF2173678.1 hypothetical protein M409DRAFT_48619 [Zasmidium cellare ATCC 36951]
MALDIKARFASYTERWMLLWIGAKCLFAELFSDGFSNLLDRTFAKLYTSLSHDFAKCEADLSPVPRYVALADGITLELGPGCGTQLPRMNAKALTHVYGIEPNTEIIPALQEKVESLPEIRPIYTTINASFEDEAALKAHGIVEASLDTIVCMQVMCSVPDAVNAAKRAHRLLKPGGQFLFWEHTANFCQLNVSGLWNIIWSPLLGGCAMGVDVETAIMNAGPWDIVELGRDEGSERPYNLLPRVWGRLVKVEQ